MLGDLLQPEERPSKFERAIDFIKRRFPRVDVKTLGPIGFSKKGARADIVSFGPEGGETQIFKKDGSGFLKSFIDKFSKSLGPSAEEILAEDRDTIQEQRHRFVEAEIQLREADKIAAEKENEEQEKQNLEQQINRILERFNALEGEHGSNLESEAELQRLKQLKKNYETDLENKKKEVAALDKIAKNKEKAQRKVDRERAKLAEKERERNLIEERLNSTNPLDDLKERESELKRQNEEDQAIAQDANASPSERKAAEARVAERYEELARLQTQVEERERARPLSERV